MNKSGDSKIMMQILNHRNDFEERVDSIKKANLYITGYSKTQPDRVEKVYPDGRVELLPVGISLMEARVQQREDSILAGLSG